MVQSRVAVAILLGCQLAVAADPPSVKDTPKQRLAYMQATGASYDVTLGDGRKAKFRPDPVLRWTNPVSGVIDGGLFVWQDESQRPIAAAQIFIAPGTEDLWLHEFQSLARQPIRFTLRGRPVWTPQKPGIDFKELEDAPPPANSATASMSQMRRICRRFSIQDDFLGDSEDHLRLMPTPLLRYSDESANDAAIFTFAHGTDPELLLVIELRAAAAGEPATWHVGLAPMTSYAITAELDGREYWSVPWRRAPHPSTATFLDFQYPSSF